jgi:hypothetical protein
LYNALFDFRKGVAESSVLCFIINYSYIELFLSGTDVPYGYVIALSLLSKFFISNYYVEVFAKA